MQQKVKLNNKAVIAIETILDAGYDVEIRRNKNGVTIASVGKKVTYKEDPTTDREVEK